MDYKREVQSFTNISSYSYRTNVIIQYPYRLQFFPNFTCFSTQNHTKLTRLVVHGTNEYFEITAASTSNDYYKSHFPQDSCPAYTYFAVSAAIPHEDNMGPCYSCFLYANATRQDLNYQLIPLKHNCEKYALCQSLWPYELQIGCMSIFDGGFEPPCGTGVQEIFCFTSDNKKCVASNDMKPFVISCQNTIQSGVVQATFGFYGIRKLPDFSLDPADQEMVDDMVELVQQNYTSETFVGQPVEFRCRVTSIYCGYPLWISITYEEGETLYSELLYNSNNNPKLGTIHNITSPHYPGNIGWYYETLYEFVVLKSGQFTTSCHCPIFNSSGWINATETVIAQDVESLEILSLSQDSSKPFRVGDRNGSLECRFKGRPISNIRWEIDGKPLPKGIYIEIFFKSENKSVLRMPEVYNTMASRYTCKVESIFEEAEAQFSLQVRENIASTWLTVGVSVLIGLTVISGLVTLHLWRINKYKEALIRNLTESEIKEFKDGNPNCLGENGNSEFANAGIQMQPYEERFEISMDDIELDYTTILGAGAFGMVVKGMWINGCHDYQNICNYSNSNPAVAVKMVKPDVEVQYFKALLSEIKIMAYLGDHKHLVKFYGASTENIQNRKVYIIVELCSMGSLESYLRNVENRQNFTNLVKYGKLVKEKIELTPFSTRTLFMWSSEIARGLEYVHAKNVVHGDLAIRNVLLTQTLTAKISDFGLSRQLANSSNYVKKSHVPLPWRHMSPEALQDRNFSTSSDIWALGVTLWEIFELGHIPYPGETWGHPFLCRIISGERLIKPKYATNELYEFMLYCWELQPEQRPRADSLTILMNEFDTVKDN
ncbi:Vascular endothelial growth factor receptor 3 [Folsomia candida]|uniref:Vascular endothelial growth factor receptor 3 n=1 Tax=Folsomia candida TaxID=158441 RepID=A0A226D887_FOLCA|nr:Vascular endothelial growth factor receptor 3 [Folsomia candida]